MLCALTEYHSITKDPSNSKIFTNRALTRIRLSSFEASIDDCIRAIELEPGSLKGYYYLAQAQLAINHPNEALPSALTAYEACLAQHSSSTTAVSGLVLQAKKQKWEAKERQRMRAKSELLRELEDSIIAKKKEELQELKQRRLEWGDEKEEKADIELAARKKIEELRNVFALADPKNFARRVPTIITSSS